MPKQIHKSRDIVESEQLKHSCYLCCVYQSILGDVCFKLWLNFSSYNLNSQQMTLKTLALCLLSLLVLGLPQQSRNLREINSCSDSMQKVEKLVDIPFQYQLPATPTWQPYPQLKFTINLQFPQYVIVTIKISLYLSVPCRMKFRVVIDGVEHRIFRHQMGDSKYIMYFTSSSVWLLKGDHTIQVEYIKSGSEQFILNDKINMAMLKLEYLQYQKDDGSKTSINVFKQMRNRKVYAEPSYPISLVGDYVWRIFPGLQVSFELQTAQNVLLHYKTSMYFTEYVFNYYQAIRVLINGKEYQKLRTISGGAIWHTNQSDELVFLQAGRHYVRAQYNIYGTMRKIQKHDWLFNYLEVRY